jgi:molybdopterin converting factor small subunit
MIRVILPAHLRTLAQETGEVVLEVQRKITIEAILDALEMRYPVLQGTIRDRTTGQRRALVRFFACGEDLSHEPVGLAVPEAVAQGKEPFCIVGAMAGG